VLERQRSLKRCRHLLDSWRGQNLETLERCIARLLAEENSNSSAAASGSTAPGSGSAAGSSVATAPPSGSNGAAPALLDMESRIEALFLELNRDALHFQELYYSERLHIGHLDQQRCAGWEETLQAPAA
jgi:DNA primase